MNYIAPLPAILDENGDPAAIDSTPVLSLYRNGEVDTSVEPTLDNPSLGIYAFVAEDIEVSGQDAIWGSVYIPGATPSTIVLPVQCVVRATDQDGNAIAIKSLQLPADDFDLWQAAVKTMVIGVCGPGSTTKKIVVKSITTAGGALDQFNGRALLFRGTTLTTGLRGQGDWIIGTSAAALPEIDLKNDLSDAPAEDDTFIIV